MTKQGKISASMMCANPFYLREILNTLEQEKIEYLHQDIMDGKFVPNLGMGLDNLKALRECTKIPFDFHLMVLEPDNIIPLLGLQPNDIISIHYESTFQVQRTLENARKYGAKVFLAINPATSLYNLEEVIHYIDGINLLTVNPGFAGQKIVQSSFKKAEKLQQLLKDHHRENIDFEVDGNITFENAKILRTFGANIFVAGTSSIFKKNGINKYDISDFRKIIDELF